MQRSWRRTVLTIAALAIAGLSCGREITGPSRSGPRLSAALALSPRLPQSVRAADGSSLVAYQSVRLVFQRAGGALALDRTYAFPSTADSLALNVAVPLGESATDQGESFNLTLRFIAANGVVLFEGGPVPVFARAEGATGEPPAPIEIPVTYVGPGAEATRLVIGGPVAVQLTGTESIAFSVQAFDAIDQLVPDAAVVFTSSDTSVLQVDATGNAVARNKRGSALVIARLLAGPADTVSVSVQPTATSMAVQSGAAQTGPAGSALSQPITVRVKAADGGGVSGVVVSFATTSGGTLSSASVTTNSAGDASVTWSLGAAIGAQTMTANAAGLEGSPLTFTATATAAIATQLQFTVQPSTMVAGGTSTPAVQVRALTAAGETATNFNGAITIALAANPGAGVLSGVLTVNAVSGFADFGDYTLQVAGTGYALSASAPGLSGATSNAFSVSPGGPVALQWVQQPVGGTAGVALVPAPRVRSVDTFGNLTPFVASVSLAFGVNAGGATLSGVTSVAFENGEAVFANVVVSAVGAGYTLVASAPALPSATSGAFNIGAGSIAWANASGGLWSNAANWSPARVPVAGDTVAITLSGTYSVTLDVNPTVASITLGGASGVQTLSASGRTVTFSDAIAVGTNGVLRIANGNVTGGGIIQNAGSLELLATTVQVRVANSGSLTASGFTSMNDSLTTALGSLLRVGQLDGSTSQAQLSMAKGFTNLGTIELTTRFNAGYSARLLMSGLLVNAPQGTILATPGLAAGGQRSIAGSLDNQGLMAPAVPMLLEPISASMSNSGTIDLTVADLTVNQSGISPSFTNLGTIQLATGRTLALNSGAFVQQGAILGAGSLALVSVTANFAVAFTNAQASLDVRNSVLNGVGTITNAVSQTLTLIASSVNAPLVNDGTLVASGNSAVNGALSNTTGAVLRVAQVDGSTSQAQLTVANGFTNNGIIEISVVFNAAYSAQLTVTNGTLVNALGATIAALPGTAPGGQRGLAAALDNRGTVVVQVPLVINRASSQHFNTGLIDATLADFTVNQSGVSPSFTNAAGGTIALASGRTWTVTSGGVVQEGSVTGAGAVAFTGLTATLGVPFTNAQTSLVLQNSTVNGPGTLTNAAGKTLTLVASTVNAPLSNEGTLQASGSSAINGVLLTAVTSILRVGQVDGSTSQATLTVANGFSNLGLIELTTLFNAAYSAQLTVTNGTLTNTAGGTIRAVPGVVGGGTRTLAAELLNQGSVELLVPLLINRSSSAHVNEGVIDAALADLTIAQSGVSPSLVNTGSLLTAGGRTITISSGAFSQGGLLSGGGTLRLNSTTANLVVAFTNSSTTLEVNNSTVNGPATLTNATGRTLTLVASTINAPLVNAGTLDASGSSLVAGALTTETGSLIRVGQVDGSTSFAHLTVTNGFTNVGTIEVTNRVAFASYSSQLSVTNGTLINASGATLTSVPGLLGGGSRTLAAQLLNQGSLDILEPLTINRASSAHVNEGIIDAALADLAITQSGASPSFVNSGSILTAGGRTITISNGTFAQDGVFSGAGTLRLNSTTLSLGVAFANSVTSLIIANSTISGPATLTNAVGKTLTLVASTINAPLVNAGTLEFSGSSVVNDSLTLLPGSLLRVGQVDGSTSFAHLTVTNGFTNAGTLELTNLVNFAGYASQLTVTNGTLLNAVGGTIAVVPGTLGGGARTLVAQLDNQGTFTVNTPFSLNRSSSSHVNSGTITVGLADFVVNQSGTSPSFTNASGGTIVVDAGRTLTVTAGTLVNDGAFAGLGALTLTSVNAALNGSFPNLPTVSATNSTLNIATPLNTGALDLSMFSTTVTGAGSLTIPSGDSLLINASTLNVPVLIQGTLVSTGASTITGALTPAVGSVLRIGQVDGATSLANLTVANGFSNSGQIALTNSTALGAYSSQLTVTSGTLVNTPSGTIVSFAGANGGGARTVAAPVNNQGTIVVAFGGAGRLQFTQNLASTGNIQLELGGTTLYTEFDRIDVAGTLTIGGGFLNVSLFNGFTPVSGNSFGILNAAGGITGTFGGLNLPSGIASPPTYGPNLVTLVAP